MFKDRTAALEGNYIQTHMLVLTNAYILREKTAEVTLVTIHLFT